MSLSLTPSSDSTSRRRRTVEAQDSSCVLDPHASYNHGDRHDQQQDTQQPDATHTRTPSPHHSSCPSAKCVSPQACESRHVCEDSWEEIQSKRTIRAENEVEANKLVNNYRFGFRKWKSHVTARPFEDRSDVVKELYSELNVIKPHSGPGQFITCGNVVYVLLFGWWVSLVYFLVGILMFITIIGVPHGKLCWKLCCYFLWPFGNTIHEIGNTLRRCCEEAPDCECSVETMEDSSPVLLPSATEGPAPEMPERAPRTPYWHRLSTYVWLLLGYPPLAVVHSLVCFISWILVFTIPVSKMSAHTLSVILLLPPEDILLSTSSHGKHQSYETRALLCCYHAANWYYYKYTVDGINVFAVIIVALVIGYVDRENQYVSSEVKFATAISSIIPLSYYIGMGIASIAAQSNFAVGAVVNATFGSITELTFYITALLRGHWAANPCLQEVVKAALTGTLLGCILFIPGISMIIGGLKHSEQRFNSRSAGVSSALLFISVGGVFAPTLFSKAYGNLVCDACTNTTGGNSTGNGSGLFVCHNCHYDLKNGTLFRDHIQPLVYTVSALLPAAYIIGLIFTLKTHSHIYNIHVGEGQGYFHSGQPVLRTFPLLVFLAWYLIFRDLLRSSYVNSGTANYTDGWRRGFKASELQASAETRHHGTVVHWSRWRSLLILIVATVLMSACADLTTEHIQPILNQPNISQYFIGVTVLAMVPEIPEIVNGIQFALQNNISLSLEVGSCIAVQVCMLQIPILVFFNAFCDVGFVLLFSDQHMWASIFSVILVNYIFMDGKSDYFQGTALVVVYLILLASYYFAPSPAGC